MIDYDSELRRHYLVLRRALDVGRRDRVLDIGCGAGLTTRDAAVIARDGSALGIDINEGALRHARQLAIVAGIRNVDFVCGDAARHPFSPSSFDVAISRFGTMFFADPASAFTSIHDALRHAGRLVMLVWQAARHNAWAVSIHRALLGDDTALPEPTAGPSAFSLGDVSKVEDVLQAASFVDVEFQEVREPVYYGPDVKSAFEFVSQFSNVTKTIESQSAGERARTLDRLRDVLTAHRTNEGVLFDSRAWIVTARSG